MMIGKSARIAVLGTALLVGLGAFQLGPAAVQAAVPASNTALGGALQAGFGVTAPATLMVQSPKHGLVSVLVTSSTKLVRRYNGQSALDEFSPGDNLSVVGVMSGTTAMTATLVKDNTIQKAFTRNVGSITAISPSSTSGLTQISVQVLHDSRVKSQNPFHVGATLTFTVSSAMTVTLADGSAGTVANLTSGMTIVSLGVFNRHSQSFGSVAHIRVTNKGSATPGTSSQGVTLEIAGVLQSGFSATTLMVQTRARGLVTVNVTASTAFTGRSGNMVSATQLKGGDRLVITGTAQGHTALNATAIQDLNL